MTVLTPERTHYVAPEGLPEPAEDDFDHVVCHCTKYQTSWCMKHVNNTSFTEETPEQSTFNLAPNPCSLCYLALELNDVLCPWGCACDECIPIED